MPGKGVRGCPFFAGLVVVSATPHAKKLIGAEEVSRHRGKDVGQGRVGRGHLDHVLGGAEPALALGDDHHRAPLWARKMPISFTTSSAAEPVRPAAQTRVRGSEDRSICFLSSVVSQATAL